MSIESTGTPRETHLSGDYSADYSRVFPFYPTESLLDMSRSLPETVSVEGFLSETTPIALKICILRSFSKASSFIPLIERLSPIAYAISTSPSKVGKTSQEWARDHLFDPREEEVLETALQIFCCEPLFSRIVNMKMRVDHPDADWDCGDRFYTVDSEKQEKLPRGYLERVIEFFQTTAREDLIGLSRFDSLDEVCSFVSILPKMYELLPEEYQKNQRVIHSILGSEIFQKNADQEMLRTIFSVIRHHNIPLDKAVINRFIQEASSMLNNPEMLRIIVATQIPLPQYTFSWFFRDPEIFRMSLEYPQEKLLQWLDSTDAVASGIPQECVIELLSKAIFQEIREDFFRKPLGSCCEVSKILERHGIEDTIIVFEKAFSMVFTEEDPEIIRGVVRKIQQLPKKETQRYFFELFKWLSKAPSELKSDFFAATKEAAFLSPIFLSCMARGIRYENRIIKRILSLFKAEKSGGDTTYSPSVNRALFKNGSNGISTAFIEFLQITGGSLWSPYFSEWMGVNEKKLSAFESALFFALQGDMLETRSRLQLLKAYVDVFNCLPEGEIDTPKMLIEQILSYFGITPEEKVYSALTEKILSMRQPTALFTYLSSINKIDEMKIPITRFLELIIKGSVHSYRYGSWNTQLEFIEEKIPGLKEKWKGVCLQKPIRLGVDLTTPSTPPLEIIQDSKEEIERIFLMNDATKTPEGIDLLTSFTDVLRTHDLEKIKELASFESLEGKIAKLYCENSLKEKKMILGEVIREVLSSDAFINTPLYQLVTEWKELIPLVKLHTVTVDLGVSDSFEDLLLMGTEVRESCLHVHSAPNTSKALMGTILNGAAMLIVCKDLSGTIISRAICRIVVEESTQMPALCLNKTYVRYPGSDEAFERIHIEYARNLAAELGINYYVKEASHKIKVIPEGYARLIEKPAIDPIAPYEYIDDLTRANKTSEGFSIVRKLDSKHREL